MRIVTALGGNALLKRGEPMTVEVQRRNVRVAVAALAELARAGHRLIITHGNGPHIGMLAMRRVEANGIADPLDLICAQTVGMIGYLIAQELGNALGSPGGVMVTLTQIEVDPHDPAFKTPTKPIGASLSKREAEALAVTKGWSVMRDGDHYRRAVPSPMPHRVIEIDAIRRLADAGIHVICAGGGGVPVVRRPNGGNYSVEAVIDKDHSSALLAKLLQAEALLLLTDVDGVYRDWGQGGARKVDRLRTSEIEGGIFTAGSMEPKVMAAASFVRATGRMCGIGKLEDAARILDGRAGTSIVA